MERKIRYAWWGVLALLLAGAVWKVFLPHGSSVTVEKTGANREIVVYVSGAVEKPGLIRLSVDARLNDAIKQANPLPEANIDLLNPAEKLKDGQKITVPYKPPAQIPGQGSGQGSGIQNTGMNGSVNASVNGSVGTGSASLGNASGVNTVQGTNGSANTGNASSGLININSAGVEELDKLPGIGPSLAERIIQYRNEHGPFTKPEDLQKVSGIGAKTYEKMASMVTVGP